jgi:hypothetical protein
MQKGREPHLSPVITLRSFGICGYEGGNVCDLSPPPGPLGIAEEKQSKKSKVSIHATTMPCHAKKNMPIDPTIS